MEESRATDWLRQARNDLEWGRVSLKQGFFSQACFIAQQASEKALKALALFRGASSIRSHSVVKIAKDLGIDGEIRNKGKLLDKYYITARYPDALPSGAPYEFYESEEASEALDSAEYIINFVSDQIK